MLPVETNLKCMVLHATSATDLVEKFSPDEKKKISFSVLASENLWATWFTVVISPHIL